MKFPNVLIEDGFRKNMYVAIKSHLTSSNIMDTTINANQIAIIIPLYKTTLSPLEKKALTQCVTVLKAYSIILASPQTLDTCMIKEEFAIDSVEYFDDFFFKNIAGYNALMLSSQFYERFLNYRYILIYQLDAYVFNDSLIEWSRKGYDYIGAPWLKKPIYNFPIISNFMNIVHQYLIRKNKPSKQSLYNKVGNGGLSLRKVETHYRATIDHKDRIANYLKEKRSHFYNEDVFWATEVPTISFPDISEALMFSFDKYPRLCFQLNNKTLPFGCHAWYKRKMKSFWKPIIGF